jgi:hypothetical protein
MIVETDAMREARANLTDGLVGRRGADRTTLESLTREIAVLAAIRDGASINRRRHRVRDQLPDRPADRAGRRTAALQAAG